VSESRAPGKNVAAGPVGAPGNSSLEARLRQRLASLQPLRLELDDDSAQHAGHAGAAGGGGHYGLLIVAQEFSGKSALARHRLVYDALGELLRGPIHALSIRALTPDEAQRSGLLL
jgi:BolA family transcriptional regulator, general stress-responsive regulator